MSVEQQREVYKQIVREELPTAFPKSSVEALIGLTEINYQSDETLNNRVENLEDNETVFQVFQYVGTSASGAITTYTGGSIFDIYGDGLVDAIVVKADGNQNPIEEAVFDASLNKVGVNTLIDNGNGTASYVLTGAPTSNACIVYFIRIRDIYKENVDFSKIIPPAFKIKGSPSNVIVVAKVGGDYTDVVEALNSITGNSATNRYTIQVAPGIYTIDNDSGAVALKDYVNIVALGTRDVIFQPSTATNDMFSGANFTYIDGIVFTGNTGAAYILNHTASGIVNIWRCVLRDCANGFIVNGVNSSLEVRQLVINNPLLTTTTYGLRVLQGRVIIKDIISRSTSIVTTIIDISGSNSIVSIIDFTSISSNVVTAMRIYGGALVSMSVANILSPYDGIIAYGDNTICRLDGVKILNAQQDGFRVENSGINIDFSLYSGVVTDSVRYNFNILNPNCVITGTGFTQLEKGYIVDGAGFYTGLIDITEDDEGFNVLGELHVGSPEKGAESVMGEGDSYTRGMLVYTETDLGVFTDVTEEAKSASGSNFTFPGVTTDNSIYIASILSSGGDTLQHYGIKTKVLVAADKGTGGIVIEYWNGSSWVEVSGMETHSGDGYYPHGNNYFNDAGSHHIRYNSMLYIDSWSKNDPMSLGTSYYWIRFRVNSNIIVAPTIEQIKLHTSRKEINSDGWVEYFGKARPVGQLNLNLALGRPFEGTMLAQTVYINENLGVGYASNRFTATADKLGVAGFLPYDLDTSSPIRLIWSGYSAASGALQWTVRWGWVSDGGSYYVTEPALQPGLKSSTVSKSVSIGVVERFSVDLDIKEMISRRSVGFGDELWISIQPTTLPGNFSLTTSQVVYTKWCEGGHV